MTKTLDMQYIQYMSFFERLIGVRSVHCFSYSRTIIFAVEPKYLSRAIGDNGINIRKLTAKLKKRVKIVPEPQDINDLTRFVSIIVYPIKFRKITVDGNEAIISALPQDRASLIGRDKFRLEELQNILEEYFNIKKLRIV